MEINFGEGSPLGAASPYPFDRSWSPAQAATLAAMLEATAAKPGNVHPGASFSDMNYGHFLASAAAIGPVFEHAATWSVGQLVLEAVKATRAAVGRNTNLGMLLLFAPLAKAAVRVSVSRERASSGQFIGTQSENSERAAVEERGVRSLTHDEVARGGAKPDASLRQAVAVELAELTPADAADVYEAIRLANPGGLGATPKHDVQNAAPDCLIDAMREVAAVDAVARQYTNNFADLFDRLLPWLDEALRIDSEPCSAICRLQMRWLAHESDGLIVRKAGMEIAIQVQSLAAALIAESDVMVRGHKLQAFEDFLRGDGHRRNPGTTADLIAATLMLRLMNATSDSWGDSPT